MNGFTFGLAVLAITQTLMVRSGRAAETNAVIPYKELHEMFERLGGVNQTNLEICVFVVSTNQMVHPSNLDLTIKAAKGAIPLALTTNGQIIKFPQTKELLRENPPIFANQPKGSLSLRVAMYLPVPEGLTFPYRRLGDGVAEMNKAIKAQAGLLSFLVPKVEGVVFFFPSASAGKAKVEITSKAGRKEYTADKDGQVKLKLEKALVSENPEVKVSEKPAGIAPDMSDL